MIASSKCSPVSPSPSAMFRALGSCPSTNHDHGSSPVTITSFLIHDPRATITVLYILLSDPGHTDTGLMDKTKPHGLFLKDNFFKTVHYWTAIPPESAYANSPKGMRIHRD